MEKKIDTNGAAPEDDGPGNTRPVMTEASWCTAAKHGPWGWGTSSRWNEQR